MAIHDITELWHKLMSSSAVIGTIAQWQKESGYRCSCTSRSFGTDVLTMLVIHYISASKMWSQWLVKC